MVTLMDAHEAKWQADRVYGPYNPARPEMRDEMRILLGYQSVGLSRRAKIGLSGIGLYLLACATGGEATAYRGSYAVPLVSGVAPTASGTTPVPGAPAPTRPAGTAPVATPTRIGGSPSRATASPTARDSRSNGSYSNNYLERIAQSIGRYETRMDAAERRVRTAADQARGRLIEYRRAERADDIASIGSLVLGGGEEAARRAIEIINGVAPVRSAARTVGR